MQKPSFAPHTTIQNRGHDMKTTPRAPGLGPRHLAVLALIAVLPFGSGLIMLDPDRAIILGLANLTIMGLPLAMLIAWPELRAGLWPAGRTALLVGIVLIHAGVLALTRAPHGGFSLTTLQVWAGALIAGRGMQLTIRAHAQQDPQHGPKHDMQHDMQHGAKLARAALLAILLAGPLYMTLLPLMDALYGQTGRVSWTFTLPAFNHGRRMGHLLTASAAMGIGLVATGVLRQGRWFTGRIVRALIATLAVIALALAMWTGARGAWLALVAGTGLALLTGHFASASARARHPDTGSPASGLRIEIPALLALICVSLGVALLLPAPGALFGILDEVTSSTSTARAGDLNALSSGRLDVWRRALDLIAAAPMQGYGWGQFALIQQDFPYPQVHNLPLELLLGLGVPMGLLALGIIAHLWITAHRRAARLGPEGITALLLLDTMAVYAMVSGTYYYGVGVILTGLVWGICLAPRAPR